MIPNNSEQDPDERRWTYDELALSLRELRAEHGSPPYAEIVLRIARMRESQGLSPHAARPARTTVYDCFRTGRTRINAELVGEIVRALTDDEDHARTWVVRSSRAVVEKPGPLVDPLPKPEPAPTPPMPTPALTEQAALTNGQTTALVAVAVLMNCLLNAVSNGLGLSLYLDMIGTAVAAITLGPWWGVAVGISTNLIATATNGPHSLYFALVQAVGALAWGYGVRRLGLGRTIPRFFLLNAATAMACSAAATPILVLLYGGGYRDTLHPLLDTLSHVLRSYGAGILSGNIVYSLIDKLIAGFTTLVAVAGVPVLRRTAAQHLAISAPLDAWAEGGRTRSSVRRTRRIRVGRPSATR